MGTYAAEYRCLKCEHEWVTFQGGFGCPEGFEGDSCGANDPAKCSVRGGCWGCSPCGRSRRRYRCSACPQVSGCPQCGHLLVKWLNYCQIFEKDD